MYQTGLSFPVSSSSPQFLWKLQLPKEFIFCLLSEFRVWESCAVSMQLLGQSWAGDQAQPPLVLGAAAGKSQQLPVSPPIQWELSPERPPRLAALSSRERLEHRDWAHQRELPTCRQAPGRGSAASTDPCYHLNSLCAQSPHWSSVSPGEYRRFCHTEKASSAKCQRSNIVPVIDNTCFYTRLLVEY